MTGGPARRERLRRPVLFGAPVLTAGVLLAHPPEPTAAADLVNVTTRWLTVHVALLFCLPLLAAAVWLLLDRIPGSAATVSRVALAGFAALYAAFDALAGIGTGVLVREAAALGAGDREAAMAMAERWWDMPTPLWIFAVAGPLSWVIATGAAAAAHHRAGSGLVVVAGLLIAGPLFGFGNPLITGPLAMLALLTAALLVERRRTRVEAAQAGRDLPAAVARPVA